MLLNTKVMTTLPHCMTGESCLGNSGILSYTSTPRAQNCLLENTEVQSEVPSCICPVNVKNRTCDWSWCRNLSCIQEGMASQPAELLRSEGFLSQRGLFSNGLWQHPRLNMFNTSFISRGLKDIVKVCETVRACVGIDFILIRLVFALSWGKVSTGMHVNFTTFHSFFLPFAFLPVCMWTQGTSCTQPACE